MKKLLNRLFILLLAAAVFPAIAQAQSVRPDTLSIGRMISGYLAQDGTYGLDDICEPHIFENQSPDSLRIAAAGLYRCGTERGSRLEQLCGSTLLGIYYLYIRQADSCIYYLNNCLYLQKRMDAAEQSRAHKMMCIAYNNLALCYINLTIDYYKASGYLLNAFEEARAGGIQRLFPPILTNLCLTHYFRGDPSGLEYAQMCYDYAKKLNTSPFMAHYCMAIMEYLNEHYSEAEKYATLAIRYAEMQHTAYSKRDAILAYTIYGKILIALHREEEGVRAFENALHIPHEDIPTDIAGTYLSYSEYLIGKNRFDQALSILEQGIEVSRKDFNLVHLDKFYGLASEIYRRQGKYRLALEYKEAQKTISDSTYIAAKESALSEIKAKYKLEMYENKLKEKEISILRHTQQVQLLGLLLLISLFIAGSIWHFYYRKNKYYEALVRQYRDKVILVKQPGSLPSEEKYNSSTLTESKGQELFRQLGELMENRKIYRDRDLTIDKLTIMLHTNRTYLSRIINEQTGKNFNRYINGYRIAEAVAILSDPVREILIKKIAYNLGFNSPATFYKAFADETGVSPTVFRKTIINLQKSENTQESDNQ